MNFKIHELISETNKNLFHAFMSGASMGISIIKPNITPKELSDILLKCHETIQQQIFEAQNELGQIATQQEEI